MRNWSRQKKYPVERMKKKGMLIKKQIREFPHEVEHNTTDGEWRERRPSERNKTEGL